jgi:signal transduction histidine kinase/ActR/RegA family two-component response regulator
VHIPNLAEADDPSLRTRLRAGEPFKAYYATPLIAKGDLKGVLEIFHHTDLYLDAEWLEFLDALTGQAAIAIDNAQLFENLQRAKTELEHRVAERTAELHRMNIELESANRAKDEFLANMSHELRTPLNSIIGLSESLLEQRMDPLSAQQQRSMQVIAASGHHLLALITDILDLSKIEVGKFEYHPQLVLVDDLCRSSLAFINSQAVKKSIEVSYENDTSVVSLSADPRRVKQILINLLSNAVKFTQENGKVTLKVNTNPEQDRIEFSVIDTGIGIAPEDIGRLFQPFVQLDSTLNRQFDGTGLGLTLVQKLTDLHGGSVEVESEPGRGSRFTIFLPLGLESPEQDLGDKPQGKNQRGEQREKEVAPVRESAALARILIAEDNAANILTLGDYLESHGYEISIAHDGAEALEKAESLKPDIILMDIQMPTMNGLEAMTHLRANPRFSTTPIIALTALAMPGDRERCLQAGASEYMSKPVSLKSLLKTIETLIGQNHR